MSGINHIHDLVDFFAFDLGMIPDIYVWDILIPDLRASRDKHHFNQARFRIMLSFEDGITR